jgi:ligand-binding sensor domain-containing protein
MRHILLFYLLLFSLFSSGQINLNGLPFIRNFTPEEYDASDQNWAAVQDHRGIMYFGNNEGVVLEFDGRSWRKIPVHGNARVLSLAVDSVGTIYVGSVGEFGYLKPNNNGKLEYYSISEHVKDSLVNFSDIFKTYIVKEDVYFFSQNYLFRYDGSNVSIFDINPNRDYYNLFSFTANNRIYIGSYILGLREHIDNTTIIAPNGVFFAQKNIFSITAYDKHWVDIVTNDGIYRYHQETGEVIELSSLNKIFGETNENEAIPYHATPLSDNSLGVGFLFGERFNFVHLDSMQRPITVVNNSNGLQDESVIFLNQPQKGNSSVWLSLNNGISRIDIHSQVRVFSEESGLRGGVLSITEYNGVLFVGTMSGVFYRKQDEHGFTHFQQLSQINSSTWSFIVF